MYKIGLVMPVVVISVGVVMSLGLLYAELLTSCCFNISFPLHAKRKIKEVYGYTNFAIKIYTR